MRLLGNGFIPQIGGGGAVPYSPLAEAGLLQWMDASDASVMYTDIGGTTPVAANNDPVALWMDKSTNNKYMAAAFLPLYKVNILNGLPALYFDGVDDNISSNPVSTNVNTFAMFVVAKSLSVVMQTVIYYNGDPTVGYGIVNGTDPNTKKGALLGGIEWIDSSADADTAWTIYLLRRRSGTTNIYLNGGSSAGSSATTPITPAYGTSLGDVAAYLEESELYVAEAIFLDDADDAAANRLGNYLADRWGLTWTDIV